MQALHKLMYYILDCFLAVTTDVQMAICAVFVRSSLCCQIKFQLSSALKFHFHIYILKSDMSDGKQNKNVL